MSDKKNLERMATTIRWVITVQRNWIHHMLEGGVPPEEISSAVSMVDHLENEMEMMLIQFELDIEGFTDKKI